jgi:uncharacterized membrane protein YhaH (DUF805 family)
MSVLEQIRLFPRVVAAIKKEAAQNTEKKKKEAQSRTKSGKILFSVTMFTIIVLLAMGPAIVVVASILAIFSLIAIITLTVKLPTYVRRLMVKHDLATDAARTVSAYVILGGTLTALIAAGMVGALISSVLMVVKGVAQEEGIL